MDCTEAFATDETLIDTIHPETGLSWCFGRDLENVRQEYPTAQRVNIDEWCKAKGERQSGPVTWSEVTEAQYMEALEVVPPAFFDGRNFLLGEPQDHHAGNGQPRFAAYRNEGGKFLASSRPMTRAEFRAILPAAVSKVERETHFAGS